MSSHLLEEFLRLNLVKEEGSSDLPKGLYIVKWAGARVKKLELDKTDKNTMWAHYTNADFVVYRYADKLHAWKIPVLEKRTIRDFTGNEQFWSVKGDDLFQRSFPLRERL